MKLENKDKEFLITFAGEEIEVPSGIFEIEDKAGYHIIEKARQWKKNIEVISKSEKEKTGKIKAKKVSGATSETIASAVEKPKEEEVKETPKAEVVEKPKEEVKVEDK